MPFTSMQYLGHTYIGNWGMQRYNIHLFPSSLKPCQYNRCTNNLYCIPKDSAIYFHLHSHLTLTASLYIGHKVCCRFDVDTVCLCGGVCRKTLKMRQEGENSEKERMPC